MNVVDRFPKAWRGADNKSEGQLLGSDTYVLFGDFYNIIQSPVLDSYLLQTWIIEKDF